MPWRAFFDSDEALISGLPFFNLTGLNALTGIFWFWRRGGRVGLRGTRAAGLNALTGIFWFWQNYWCLPIARRWLRLNALTGIFWFWLFLLGLLVSWGFTVLMPWRAFFDSDYLFLPARPGYKLYVLMPWRAFFDSDSLRFKRGKISEIRLNALTGIFWFWPEKKMFEKLYSDGTS